MKINPFIRLHVTETLSVLLQVLTVQEAVEEKKTEGKKILDSYSRRITMIEHAIKDRRASKKLLDSNVQEIQSEIHEITQKLIDLLKSEERTLMQTLKNILTNETDSIEKDIARLESTKAKVKSSSNALMHEISNEDIDLINAVVKEKQLGTDRHEDENMVRKPFRDVDMKFAVSPHILSFLKHFKVLGQITLLEEPNNNKSTIRSQGVDISNDTSFSPSRHFASVEENRQSDESNLTARSRWERDRNTGFQSHTRQRDFEHRQKQFYHSNINQYHEKQRKDVRNETESGNVSPERPESAVSVNVPRGTATHFTAYPARPSSIPVDVMIEKTRQSRQYEQPYRYFRAVPVSGPSADAKTNRASFEQVERDIEFSRRRPRSAMSDTYQHSDDTRTRSKSPTSPRNVNFSLVEIKDEDGRFGRSFAAVQINELSTSFENDLRHKESDVITIPNTVQKLVHEPSQQPQDDHMSDRTYGSPKFQRKPGFRVGSRDQHMDRNRPTSPKVQHDIATVDEVKGRRWVHKAAIASNGHGSKRLISGVACLSDGRVILVDQEQYTVQMYDNAYRFLYEIKLDSRPFDVVALSDNKIAVSLQSERVLKFFLVMDGALTPVADLGVPCDLVCYGFCRGGGNYFICCGDEVVMLSDQGRLIGQIKIDVTGQALFSRAEYVSCDRNGAVVYVSDVGASKVSAVQLDGRKLWDLSFSGFQPAGIKTVENYIYVSDKGQHRIMLINTDGQVLKQNVLGRIENPCALTLNLSRNLMFVTQMRYDAIVNSPRPVQVFQLQ